MASPSPLAAGMALLVILGLAALSPRGARWRRASLTAAGAIFVLIAASYHRDASRLQSQAAQVRMTLARDGAAALESAFSGMVQALERTAAAALDAPSDRDAAFASLTALLPAEEDHAVVLGVNHTAFAWAGRLLVPIDSLRGPAGVVATPFYVVAYAVATRGDRVAVATALVHAEPPADQLSRPLDARVARANQSRALLVRRRARGRGSAGRRRAAHQWGRGDGGGRARRARRGPVAGDA